jgi:tetratricopeptide (TPR) repeat protein
MLEQIVAALAEAYGDAARRNADMRAATEALESLRAVFMSERDIFVIWTALDSQIGRAEAERLQPPLMKLREFFEQTITARELARLTEALQGNEAAGWTAWLQLYVSALCDGRIAFCCTLVEAPLPLPAQTNPPLEKIKYYTRCILHQRWAETTAWFSFLAQQDIPPEQQAKLLIVVSEIQLYHLLKPNKAKELIEQAEQISPNEVRVISGWSQYWQQQQEFEKARSFAQRAIEVAPKKEDGYVNLGDCYEKEGDLDAAEKAYQQAIQAGSGSMNGYLPLIRLYGRRERFSSYKDRLPELFKRTLAVEPTSEYGNYLEEGAIYQQNKLYDDAHRCYEKAIALDPTRLGGYTADGYAYLDEANEPQLEQGRDQEPIEKATGNFKKAVEVAPEALDGYWGIAWVCEQQEQWEEALRWCEQCLPLRPEWEGLIRARIGNLKFRLGQFKPAEEELMAALQLDPNNQQALETLTNLAADYYLKGNDREAALRIYAEVSRRRGEDYEASYQNQVGNLRYYYGQYQEAAEAYRKARAANPAEAVYHANLAVALEGLRASGSAGATELTEALEALRQAYSLAPEDNDYAKRLADLERQHSFLTRYGEAALKLKPMLKPLQALAQQELLSLIVNERQDALSDEIIQMTNGLRDRIRQRFGFTIPSILFDQLQEEGIPPGAYKLSVLETNADFGHVPLAKKFAPVPQDKLSAIEITGDPPIIPPDGVEGYWIAEEDWGKALENGIELWTGIDYLTRHLQIYIEKHLAELFSYQETVNLLAACPDEACRNISRSPQKVLTLTLALRELLKRRASIGALGEISKQFALLAETEKDAAVIGERLLATNDFNR